MVRYAPIGGATERTHVAARNFENAVGHAAGVYAALKAARISRPHLVVGHSGFGSTLFLSELFPGTPIINYFEYFYSPRDSDLDFRPDMQPGEIDRLKVLARNAMILLDLNQCAAGYTPTRYQRSLFPSPYRDRLAILHDGVDTEFWRRRPPEAPPGERTVTYVSRGLESMRGFDIFMRAAKRVARALPDVRFVVVGDDRVAYGGDLARIDGASFKEHVLAQDDYDLSRFEFTGLVPRELLADLLARSGCHVYLTVPFVLSWSLLNAMAAGCTIVASDTEPVREVITDGQTGLLREFSDVDGLADAVIDVLERPANHRRLGPSAQRLVEERFALARTMPPLAELYEDTARRMYE